MADITIASGYIEMESVPNSPAFLYIFARSDFWLFDRNPITESSPYNGSTPYLIVPLTPSGTHPVTYTYPSFTLPSTEDALINANGARWGIFLFNANGRILDREDGSFPGLSNFRLASTPSTQNLTDIAGFNTTSLPPVTNGDRIILGDLYVEDVIASGTVNAAFFVGNGAGITGLTGATGGVANIGSTTIGADTDANGTGIVSLQTRLIERVRIDNDGKLVALGAFDVSGLATLGNGAELAARQITWSTGNISAPQTADQADGSRLILYPAVSGEHFAIGVESGAMWFNISLAGSYKWYFGASTEFTALSTNQLMFSSEDDEFLFKFQSAFSGASALVFAIDNAIALDPTTMRWEMDGSAVFEASLSGIYPSTHNQFALGKTALRWSEIFATEIYIGATGTTQVGYRGIPQQSKSANYTAVLADAGKHIFHPSTDANARTFTIPANASVAYEIGTALSFINMTSQVVSIAITSDTMYLVGAGTTGTRSLAQYGAATAIKITSTTWLISGNGLT